MEKKKKKKNKKKFLIKKKKKLRKKKKIKKKKKETKPHPITNYKNYLLSQQHTASYLRSHVPYSKKIEIGRKAYKSLYVPFLSHVTEKT